MGRGYTRSSLHGSALVRVIEQLDLVEEVPPSACAVDGLAQWIGWTDAIALAGALHAPAAAASSAPAAPRADDAARDVERVRALALREIEALGGPPGVTDPRGARRIEAAPAAVDDFGVHRQDYVERQRTMEHLIPPLRERLRRALAACSPALARLAALDTVLEHALAAREKALLGALPGWLERRFVQRRDAAAGMGEADTWHAAFRDDLQRLLRAELDHRLQPARGLLAALQAHAAVSR